MDIIERLNDLSKMQTWNYNQTKKGIVCHDAIAEITALRAQVEVNKKDAERYRFMRSNDVTDIYSNWIIFKLNNAEKNYKELDCLIDEALKGK